MDDFQFCCPICENTAFHPVYSLNSESTFGTCPRCNVAQVIPMPGDIELKNIYSRFEQNYPTSFVLAENSDFTAFAQDRAALVTSCCDLSKPLRLLEIGSGYGNFLNQIINSKWELHGIEPSLAPADFARTELGLSNIQNCLLSDASLDYGSFDIICGFHVIEHVPDPINLLKYCKKLLSPNGKLFIATPNLTQIHANLIHYYFLANRLHLCLFTPKTLEFALVSSGFQMIQCTQEKNRPAETGSMLVEAELNGDMQEGEYPSEEARYGRAFGKLLETMQKDLCQRLSSWQRSGKTIALYGGGVHTQALLDCIGPELTQSIAYIFDDNPDKRGKKLHGIPIVPFKKKWHNKIDIVVVSSLASETQILERLTQDDTINRLKKYGIYRDIITAGEE